MTTPLQVGLIGYGLAGSVFHAPLIQHTAGLALHSIASSQRDRLLRSFTDVRICDHPAELFADPALDAVVIATPNAEHAPLAIAALQAGKHVLVDKPFALDLAQADAVVRAAQIAERVVTVFQNRRFDADFLTLQQLLADGVLGEVAECHSHFDRYRPQVRDRWRESDAPGAGLWMDLGPHLLDQMLQLFGWPQAISADLMAQRDGARSDDYFHAVLHYPRHRAIVHAGSLVAAARPRFAVHGSRAVTSSRAATCRKTSCARASPRARRVGGWTRCMASMSPSMPRATNTRPAWTMPWATTGACMRRSAMRCRVPARPR